MAEYILELMKRIAAFTIIAQAILHFRPNKSYEKYLKLLIGMIMLAIFIVPMAELFHKDSIREYELLLEGYERSIDRMYATSDFQINLEEETYLYTIQEEIKTRFNNIASEYGYEVRDVNLQGISAVSTQAVVEEADGQGEIQVVLWEENAAVPTVQVDKIKLGNNKTEKVSGAVSEQLNADIPILRQRFAGELGVAEDVITIVWQS